MPSPGVWNHIVDKVRMDDPLTAATPKTTRVKGVGKTEKEELMDMISELTGDIN